MSDSKDLSYIRNHFFDKSERMWWWSFGLPIFVQFLVLLTSLFNIHILTVAVVFIGVVVPLGSRWLRVKASSLAGKADLVRRMILYSDSFGEPITEEEMKTVRSWVIGENVEKPEHVYHEFASNQQAGLSKLAANTAENAFFTYNLAEKMEKYLMRILVVFAFFILLVTYLALIYTAGGKTGITTAKIFLVLASFILGGDLTFLWYKYKSLKENAQKAYTRASRLSKKEEMKFGEILFAVEDYHFALIKGPPIPFRVYSKHKEKLNEIFASQ
jgi:hypothetical protein